MLKYYFSKGIVKSVKFIDIVKSDILVKNIILAKSQRISAKAIVVGTTQYIQRVFTIVYYEPTRNEKVKLFVNS